MSGEEPRADCTCDWSDERRFIEGLIHQRTSLFMALFVAVLAGALAGALAVPSPYSALIWGGGAYRCSEIAAAIWRARDAYDLILQELSEHHPAKRVDAASEAGVEGPNRTMISRHLPVVCCIVLWLGTATVLWGWAIAPSL